MPILTALFLLGPFAILLYLYAHREWSLPRRLLAIGVLGLGAVCLFVLLFTMLEEPCSWDPWIDTVTAPGFSEEKFRQIKPGMTAEEVRSSLGEPLETRPGKVYGEDARWSYTDDGKCLWWDFAWEGREVVFNNGRVVRLVAGTFCN